MTVLLALRKKGSKRKERNNAKQRFSVVICCRSDFDLNVEEKDRESGNQGVLEGLQVTLVGSSIVYLCLISSVIRDAFL